MKYKTLSENVKLVNETLEKLGCDDLVGKIKVSFNNRFTARMGDANYFLRRIRLSGPLYMRATEQERYETTIHETCHIAAYHFHGFDIKPHGKEWCDLMRKCGLEPEVCHNVNRDGLKRKQVRHKLSCNCANGCNVGPTVYKRIKAKSAVYKCKKCNKILEIKNG